MPDLTKIATCCYCGTRAVLRLRGKDRHELSCAGCGAALHNMKALKAPARPKRAVKPAPVYHSKPKKRPKKRKSLFRHLISEAWDEIEDIFD